MGDGYTVASNTAYWNTSQDAPNPLYNRKTNSNGVAFDSTLVCRLPIEGGRWQATGSVLWGQDNNDVNFQDTTVTSVSVGVLYRFGARDVQPQAEADALIDVKPE